MRRLLLGALVLLGCETRPPSAPTAASAPSGPSAPKVDGVEGHGGIAIAEPRALPGGPQPAPTAPTLAPPTTAGANELTARLLYLQGYQLKDSDPKAAAALFRQVVALTPRGTEQHEKARSRLAELGEPPAP